MYTWARTLVGIGLLTAIALFAGCGAGDSGWNPNPWAGDYLGTYDFGNDNGAISIYVDDNGNIDGDWTSGVDSAHGKVWGDIDWNGQFTLKTEWASAWGHGEYSGGDRVLVIDGYDSRAPKSKPPFSNLKQKNGAHKPPVTKPPATQTPAPGDTIGG